MTQSKQGRPGSTRSAQSRRDFLRAASTLTGGLALLLLSRCKPAATGERPDIQDPTPTSPPPAPATEGAAPEMAAPETTTPETASPTAPAAAAQTTPELMMNENREGWYIRYIKAIPPVDVQTWTLSVDGLVDNPKTLNFEAIKAFPEVVQRSRMKCVEGWSVAAEWQGFHPQALVDLVQPKDEAAWVHFQCADDYYESLHLRELLMDRVLFAYGANSELLAPEYGAPLRLIVPAKYGYKGPKAITRISFSGEPLKGFWSKMGPYTEEGDIVAGVDYALDLDTYQVFDDMGELFYEEGLESEAN